jgi:glycosyltransferase involved in cell wall biosynthesis
VFIRGECLGKKDVRLYGLMITKDDHGIFDDWCRNQLGLYDAVFCLDGSLGRETEEIAGQYGDRLIYLHESHFYLPYKTDHGLRRVVHQEMVRRFGTDNWIMCCHADEFCYHDPRKLAAKAEAEGYDWVSWFSLHFYPHPDDLPNWEARRQVPVLERMRYYHWSYQGSGLPWVENRLYRNGEHVMWDRMRHSSTLPDGLKRQALFRPIMLHYKVYDIDVDSYEVKGESSYYRTRWAGLPDRTGVPFQVKSADDLFVAHVPDYDRCDRFTGSIEHEWNMGEEYKAAWCVERGAGSEEERLKLGRSGSNEVPPHPGPLPGGEENVRSTLHAPRPTTHSRSTRHGSRSTAPRVAVLSFLFNWPSTGGGTIHTFELASFLARAGFDVLHIYACYQPWAIGGVSERLPYNSRALDFAEREWTTEGIQRKFREAVDGFRPDNIIITDSWNMKPILAEAVAEYPYILRFQAMECLCPLNNVRLLPDSAAGCRQCHKHQLASPGECMKCLADNAQWSGGLHQAERELSGVGRPGYHEKLLKAFRDAKAVLVVNSLHEAMIGPYASDVRVVTSGIDASRFPVSNAPLTLPSPPEAGGEGRALGSPCEAGEERKQPGTHRQLTRILFAGLVEEYMKGFTVLHEACERIRQHRYDFELVATGDPPGQMDDFTRFIGWQSQEQLARQMYDADMVVMPTIAQEALGRTAVEAMAAGRPVIASGIGGLPFTVIDGSTGLLCEPGDPADLAAKIEVLLDDPELRTRLGQAGRRRFEEHYRWEVIIEKHYRPLLEKAERRESRDESRARAERAERGDKSRAKAERQEQSTELLNPLAPRFGGRGQGEGGRAANRYMPFIPAWTNLDKLFGEIADFFECDRETVERKFGLYEAIHKEKRHAETLGERKTLCLEEAFILYLVLERFRPRTILEIGTQHGKSARRLIDMQAALGLDAKIVCFDIVDEVKHFARDEAELVLKDLTGIFRNQAFNVYMPQIIFCDVHRYNLMKEVISTAMESRRQCIVAIHDCGLGLCNPTMPISRDDPDISSSTGLWDRHVLAELFKIADPLSPDLDRAKNRSSRLRIFSTPHGLGLVVPRKMSLKAARRKSTARA